MDTAPASNSAKLRRRAAERVRNGPSDADLDDVSVCEYVLALDRLAVEGAVTPDAGEFDLLAQVLVNHRREVIHRCAASQGERLRPIRRFARLSYAAGVPTRARPSAPKCREPKRSLSPTCRRSDGTRSLRHPRAPRLESLQRVLDDEEVRGSGLVC